MRTGKRLRERRFDWASATDRELVDWIARTAYAYFPRYSHPETGFTQDRSSRPRLSSIAASGLALAAHGVAATRDWIDEADASDRIRRILRSFGESPFGWRGFYPHFVDMRTGDPVDDCEVSLIDTALLLAGAVIARARFAGDGEIVGRATDLIGKAEWDRFFDAERGLFHMAWKPRRGPGYGCPAPGGDGWFCGSRSAPVYWGTYTDEVLLIALLAAASPTHPVPIGSLAAIDMSRGSYEGPPITHSYTGSLFTYFLASCYLDTEALGQARDGFQWFVNTRRAVEANRRYAASLGLPDWAFGITACDGPDGGYHGYGAPPATLRPRCDGTVATYGILGSILHAPKESLAAARRLLERGVYDEEEGLADAVNLLRPWTNWDRLGINQGEMLLVLENASAGTASSDFMSDPALSAVLRRRFPGWTRS